MSKFITGNIKNYQQLYFLDDFLRGHKGYIAGGCFKNILTGESVKDIDIYFRNESDFLEAKKYFKSEMGKESRTKQYKKSYENRKVWAVVHVPTGIRLELIRSVFAEPERLIETFDFTVTKMAYYVDKKDDEEENLFKIVYHENFFEHLLMRRLVIDNDPQELPAPISTFNRSYKYAKYGFFLCKESKAKLIQAIQSLPALTDIDEVGMSLYNGID